MPREQLDDPRALVEPDRRADLEHLAAPVDREALALRALGDRSRRAPRRRPRRARRASESRRSRPCPPPRTRRRVRVGCRARAAKARDARRPLLAARDRPRPRSQPGAQQLTAVVADVRDRADRDDRAGRRGAPPADAGRRRRSAWRSRSAACASPRARCASAAWRTIGASVPSMSSRMALAPGRRGAARAPRSEAASSRDLVCRHVGATGALRSWRSSARRGGPVQRTVRRRRRQRDRAAARAVARLSSERAAIGTSLAAIALIALFAARVPGRVRQRRSRQGRARRAPGAARGGARRLRSASGCPITSSPSCSRCLLARRGRRSGAVVIARPGARVRRRRDQRPAGRRRRDPVRPHAHPRALAQPGAGRVDVAAGDRAGGDPRRRPPAPVREPRAPRRRADRPAVGPRRRRRHRAGQRAAAARAPARLRGAHRVGGGAFLRRYRAGR